MNEHKFLLNGYLKTFFKLVKLINIRPLDCYISLFFYEINNKKITISFILLFLEHHSGGRSGRGAHWRDYRIYCSKGRNLHSA